MIVEDRSLSAFFESDIRRYIRIVSLCIAVVLILCGCYFIDAAPFELLVIVSIWLLSVFWRSFADRYLIAIQTDGITSEGKKTEWWDIQDISVNKDFLILDLKENRKTKIRLKPFTDGERGQIVIQIRAMWQTAKVSGKLQIPEIEDVVISSDNLKIRALSPADKDAYVAHRSNQEESELQLYDALPDSLESSAYNQIFIYHEFHALYWTLGIFRDSDDEYVGFITLLMDTTFMHRSAVLGLGITQTNRKRGYGTEAITALIDYVDKNTNLIKITAGCYTINPQCVAALEKSGMRKVGTREKYWCRSGKWLDSFEFEKVFDRDTLSQPTP